MAETQCRPVPQAAYCFPAKWCGCGAQLSGEEEGSQQNSRGWRLLVRPLDSGAGQIWKAKKALQRNNRGEGGCWRKCTNAPEHAAQNLLVGAWREDETITGIAVLPRRFDVLSVCC